MRVPVGRWGSAMANGNSNNNERRGRWQGFDLGGGGGTGTPGRLRASPWMWIIGFLLILFLFRSLAAPRPEDIAFSDFLTRVDDGQIEGVLEISATTVTGTYEDTTGTQVDFTSTIPPILQGTSRLIETLDEQGVAYRGVQPNALQSFLVGWVVPLLLFGLLWFFLVRRMSGAQTGAAPNLG